MKTRLTLVAVAAMLTTGAYAQTTTTIWGRINISEESVNINGKTSLASVDNRSRIGFRMNRKIDADLSVGAALEVGYNTMTGAQQGTLLFGRESSLNLSGSFGTVTAGRFLSRTYLNMADAVSNHNHDTGTSSDAFWNYTTYAMISGVNYAGKTGDFDYGASLGARKNLNGNTNLADDASPTASELNVGYNKGPLSFGVGHESMAGAKNSTSGMTGTVTTNGVRANYSMGDFSLAGYLATNKDNSVVSGTVSSNTLSRISAQYNVGKSEFHLNLGRASATLGAVGGNSGATQATLFYNYNIIPRELKVYAGYTAISNNTNGAYSLNGGGFGPSANTGTRSSALSAGIRYNF